ncbi:hypothetical protein AAFB50_001985 [Enterococcus faecalis]|uniref:hypothetical protein n=1 Tax=Aerococcus mictus TaxID=2976810 RepID=UPI00227A1ED2|nr:hypothetical protein [Aerococcus mictus]MCY3077237.1 hypothetical protein [Aerococcus mictus]HBM4378257.1 hypothetical protein [Enterococcus faecium]HBM4421946.1 hypothetical protein [Enterococcus faecium]
MIGTIGIIGVNGEIGKLCYKALKDYGITNIKAGVRDKELLKSSFDLNYEFIDLLDKDSCFCFAKKCDCIINCSSASKEGIYNIVESVELTKGMLVDLTYYENINLPKIKNSVICHGVGVSPGLTEAIPKILSKEFDEITTFKLYYIVMDTFSYSSAYAYLKYMNSDSIYPLTEIQDGKLVPSLYNNPLEIAEISDGKVRQITYMDDRVISICKELKILNSKFTICIPDGHTYKLLTSGKLKSGDIEEQALKLVNASILDRGNSEPYCCFLIDIEGVFDEMESNSCLSIRAESSLKLTALVSTAVSILMLKYDNEIGLYDMFHYKHIYKLLETIKEVDKGVYISMIRDKSIADLGPLEGEI